VRTVVIFSIYFIGFGNGLFFDGYRAAQNFDKQ
jgi:hypothetical protein